jgi:hypothetical protein
VSADTIYQQLRGYLHYLKLAAIASNSRRRSSTPNANTPATASSSPAYCRPR